MGHTHTLGYNTHRNTAHSDTLLAETHMRMPIVAVCAGVTGTQTIHMLLNISHLSHLLLLSKEAHNFWECHGLSARQEESYVLAPTGSTRACPVSLVSHLMHEESHNANISDSVRLLENMLHIYQCTQSTI